MLFPVIKQKSQRKAAGNTTLEEVKKTNFNIKKYDSYRGFPENVKLPMNRDEKTNFGIKNLWNRNEKWKNY